MARTAAARFQQHECTFADRGAESLLRSLRLDSAEAVFARCASTHRRRANRDVCELQLETETGPARVFAKLNWGRQRLWPRMTDLKTGQVFQTLPEREWCGLETLARLGMNVPQRLALFRQGWFEFHAAILIHAVPPAHSLESLLHTRQWWELPAGDRQTILAEVAATMRTIHAAGYGWRGTCSRHFFPERATGGGWKLWLIDCEGVHRLTSRKAIARDERKLLDSMHESGADEETLRNLQQHLAATAARRRAA